MFSARFNVTEQTRIIDIGGVSAQWMRMEPRPNVTLVNITPESNCPLPQVIADGRLLPFADNEFDIAFSNSVIEHVGDTKSQKAFANEVMRVAQHFWVQTPNRWFPASRTSLRRLSIGSRRRFGTGLCATRFGAFSLNRRQNIAA
jgi:hypothetical protein